MQLLKPFLLFIHELILIFLLVLSPPSAGELVAAPSAVPSISRSRLLLPLPIPIIFCLVFPASRGNQTSWCLSPPLLPPSSSSSSSSFHCHPASQSPSAVTPAWTLTQEQPCPPYFPPPPSCLPYLMIIVHHPALGISVMRWPCASRASCYLSGTPKTLESVTRWPELWSTSCHSCTCSWECPSLLTASWHP